MLPRFAYPVICQWTRGLLPCFNYCEQCSCEHGHTNISSRSCFQLLWVYVYYSEVELLGHMIILVFIFKEHTLFHHFDIPINCAQELQLFRIFANIVIYCFFFFFNISHSKGMRWYLTVALIYVSLMIMLLNCGVGEDSWESLGLQGDPTSPFWRRSALGFLWKEWR